MQYLRKNIVIFLLPLCIIIYFLCYSSNIDKTIAVDSDKIVKLYFITDNGMDIEPICLTFGKEVVLPYDLQKEGYIFMGWYIDSERTLPFNIESVTDDTTLYAKWQKKIINVVFYFYGGIVRVQTIEYGSKVDLPPDTAREGYDFLGWYMDENYQDSFDNNTFVTEDFKLYGQWTEIYHKISIVDWDGTEVFESEVKEGGVLELPELSMTGLKEFNGFYIGEEKINTDAYAVFFSAVINIVYDYPVSNINLFVFSACAEGYYVKAADEADGDIFLPPTYSGELVVGISPANSEESGAFYNSKITSVYIPAFYSCIGAYSFYGCELLTYAGLNSGALLIIEKYAFYGSGLVSANLSEAAVEIGDSVFENCRKLEGIEIPDSVLTVGEYAFSKCIALQYARVSRDSALTAIYDNAFSDCVNLAAFYVPKKTAIYDSDGNIGGATAFIRCAKLSVLSVSLENPFYSSMDGVLYDKNKTTIYCYPAGKTERVYDAIEESVTNISAYAFYNNNYLNEIILPKNLVNIDIFAFAYTSVKKIYFPSSIKSIGIAAFWYCSALQSVEFAPFAEIAYMGEFSFYLCSALSTFIITAAVPPAGDGESVVFFSYGSRIKIYVPADNLVSYKQKWTDYIYNISAIQGVDTRGAF